MTYDLWKISDVLVEVDFGLPLGKKGRMLMAAVNLGIMTPPLKGNLTTTRRTDNRQPMQGSRYSEDLFTTFFHVDKKVPGTAKAAFTLSLRSVSSEDKHLTSQVGK